MHNHSFRQKPNLNVVSSWQYYSFCALLGFIIYLSREYVMAREGMPILKRITDPGVRAVGSLFTLISIGMGSAWLHQRRSYHKLTNEVQGLSDELAEIKQAKSIVEAELGKNKKELSAAEAALDKNREELTSLSDKLTNTTEKQTTVEPLKADIAAQLTTKEELLADISAQLEKEKKDSKEKDAEIQTLRAKISSLTDDHQHITAKSGNALKLLAEKDRELTDLRSRLGATLEEKTRELALANAQIGQLTSQMSGKRTEQQRGRGHEREAHIDRRESSVENSLNGSMTESSDEDETKLLWASNGNG